MLSNLTPYSLRVEPVVAHQTSWLKSTGEYIAAVLSKNVQVCITKNAENPTETAQI